MPLPLDVIRDMFYKALEPHIGETYDDGKRIECNLALMQVMSRIQADDGDAGIELTAADARRMGEVPEHIPNCATAIFRFQGAEKHPVFPDKVNIPFVQSTPWKWFEINFVI